MSFWFFKFSKKSPNKFDKFLPKNMKGVRNHQNKDNWIRYRYCEKAIQYEKIEFPSKFLYKGLVNQGQMKKLDAIYLRKVPNTLKKTKFLVKMRRESGWLYLTFNQVVKQCGACVNPTQMQFLKSNYIHLILKPKYRWKSSIF